MKTIIRNFLTILRRFRMATALNVMGLAVAFAAFLVIMMQLYYEYSYDSCHPGADCIYRVDLCDEESDVTVLPGPFLDEFARSSPHIAAATFINPFIGNVYLTVQDSTGKKGFREPVLTCRPDLTKVFGFAMVEGDAACLNDPEKLILPQSMAKRLFGEGSATGKQIYAEEEIWTKDKQSFTVGGVYKDFPSNTQIGNAIYIGIDNTPDVMCKECSNFVAYVRLDNPGAAARVADNFNKQYDFAGLWKEAATLRVRLLPLADIYFMDGSSAVGNRETTRLLFFIAILIVGIAHRSYSRSLSGVSYHLLSSRLAAEGQLRTFPLRAQDEAMVDWFPICCFHRPYCWCMHPTTPKQLYALLQPRIR